jgi:hypothetical protein
LMTNLDPGSGTAFMQLTIFMCSSGTFASFSCRRGL